METYTATSIIKILKERNLSLFTLNDFSRIFGIKNTNTLYKKVERLKTKGIITQLVKGKYSFVLFPPSDYAVANFLYQPSYISCETALSFYGIITGFPYQITSVTPKRARNFVSENKEFDYSQISSRLFWGYEKKEDFLVAEKEKALLDYLYLGTKGLKSLELDEIETGEIDKKKFLLYAKKFKNKKILKIINKILK